jgi:hypothetical protein
MTSTPGGASRRIFRPVSATIGMIASAGVAALLLLDAFVRGGVEQGMLITPWVLLVLWGIYAFAYAPHVETDAAGIRLHNVLSIIDIPWALVSGIRLRWQLEVTVNDGRVMRAFGGPSLSRPRRKPETPDDDAVPPSGRDLTLIQEAWDHASERGVSATGTLQRRLDVPALVALAIIVAWTVASVMIAGSQG